MIAASWFLLSVAVAVVVVDEVRENRRRAETVRRWRERDWR